MIIILPDYHSNSADLFGRYSDENSGDFSSLCSSK
jgi:hypothetical protein